MPVSLRARPKQEPDALAKVQTQVDDLREKLLKARSRLAEIHYELDSLTAAPDERAQQITGLRAAIEQAERQHQAQEEYCALVAGHSGAEELERLRLHIEELNLQLASVETAHAAAGKERQDREAELRQEQTKLEKVIADLDSKLSTSYTVKERLIAEQGQAIKARVAEVLSQAEALEQDSGERHEQSKRVAATARRDAFQQLEAYPQLRRELAQEHKLKDDATSIGLEACLTFLDTLLEHGARIDEAIAGNPSSCVSVLHELALDAQTMRSLSTDDKNMLRAKRERVHSLLVDYRVKQSRV